MAKTVSADEVKSQFDSFLGYVSEQDDEVIVERHGKRTAVIISMAAYEDVKAILEERRRADVLEQFRRLNDRIAAHSAAHNQDLSEEDAIDLSIRISREIIDDLAARGVISFERDQAQSG